MAGGLEQQRRLCPGGSNPACCMSVDRLVSWRSRKRDRCDSDSFSSLARRGPQTATATRPGRKSLMSERRVAESKRLPGARPWPVAAGPAHAVSHPLASSGQALTAHLRQPEFRRRYTMPYPGRSFRLLSASGRRLICYIMRAKVLSWAFLSAGPPSQLLTTLPSP